MPSNRRFKMKMRRSGSKLTHSAEGYFFWGMDLGDFNNEAEASAAWRQHRVRLLLEWIAEHPGTRPFFWWEVERPRGHLRRQVYGPPPLMDALIYMGYPGHWPCKALIFEPEVIFLERLNLLTRPEIAQLPALKANAAAETAEKIKKFNAQLEANPI